MNEATGYYVCYDLKSIQRYIFAVPRLKCVIGGSVLVANFDQQQAAANDPEGAIETIYTGGGRGAFFCQGDVPQQTARDLIARLVAAAHQSGLDIRIGKDHQLAQAAHHADQLFPFAPEMGSAEQIDPACRLSGLWPVRAEDSRNQDQPIHPLIQKRLDCSGYHEDALSQGIFKLLEQHQRVPEPLQGQALRFFKSLSRDQDNEDEPEEARAAAAAMGHRNRWAVIAMDGNDIGRQFEAYEQCQPAGEHAEDARRDWMRSMSQALEATTKFAMTTALGDCLEAWLGDLAPGKLDSCRFREKSGQSQSDASEALVLPFRPLILGGDDVVLLCHPAYAMRFVTSMTDAFTAESLRQADQFPGNTPLWPASSAGLTISAGVLFAPVNFPLYQAIAYAESLLASAKGRFRRAASEAQPTPPAVDWESVTESLLDTPAARRRRELWFHDNQIDREIRLTNKPYRLDTSADQPSANHWDHWDHLQLIKQEIELLPRSLQSQLLPALRQPWTERIRFIASLSKRDWGKNEPGWLFERLREEPDTLGSYWTCVEEEGRKVQVSSLPDALALLEEEARHSPGKDKG